MKLAEIPTTELRRMLTATARAIGPESVEASALRCELMRREAAKALEPSGPTSGTEGGTDGE